MHTKRKYLVKVESSNNVAQFMFKSRDGLDMNHTILEEVLADPGYLDNSAFKNDRTGFTMRSFQISLGIF